MDDLCPRVGRSIFTVTTASHLKNVLDLSEKARCRWYADPGWTVRDLGTSTPELYPSDFNMGKQFAEHGRTVQDLGSDSP
jgi:hypothetical protein